MRNIILCDLDGTLASCNWRNHFIEDKSQDWFAYYKGISWDKPIPKVRNLLNETMKNNPEAEIIYLSAREEFLASPYKKSKNSSEKIMDINIRALTEAWLAKNDAPGWNTGKASLVLRKHDDRRKAASVKKDVLLELLKEPDTHIILAVDDNTDVIAMYKQYLPEHTVVTVTDPGILPIQKDNTAAAFILLRAAAVLNTH